MRRKPPRPWPRSKKLKYILSLKCFSAPSGCVYSSFAWMSPYTETTSNSFRGRNRLGQAQLALQLVQHRVIALVHARAHDLRLDPLKALRQGPLVIRAQHLIRHRKEDALLLLDVPPQQAHVASGVEGYRAARGLIAALVGIDRVRDRADVGPPLVVLEQHHAPWAA